MKLSELVEDPGRLAVIKSRVLLSQASSDLLGAQLFVEPHLQDQRDVLFPFPVLGSDGGIVEVSVVADVVVDGYGVFGHVRG